MLEGRAAAVIRSHGGESSPSKLVFALIIAFVAPSFSGCFGEDPLPPPPPPGIFDFSQSIGNTTYYHWVDGKDAVSDTSNHTNLTDNNTPFWAESTYYGIGFTTFEPTIGVTSSGTLVITNYRGTGDGTHIIRSQDLGQTWEDIGPFNPIFPSTGQVPSSNDPYLYVDPWTDRIIKFDMHALTAMFVEYSDDEGDSWSIPYSAEGYYSPQDHQSIASTVVPDGVTAFHETIYVFCINTGNSAAGPQCSRSLNGGLTWDIQRPGYPIGVFQCSGLHGHVIGSPDGAVYRGNPSCDGPAVYRSVDGGYTWTEHTITTTIQMVDGWHDHEVATATDDSGNLYAAWIGMDEMIWYAYSRDQGDTWSDPMMVAPPGINGSGFPTIAAGAEGRVVIGYIGKGAGTAGWNGYMSIMTDAFADRPLITTTAVNSPDDPLDTDDDCGNKRCGGFGDFIDIVIDVDGRPWIALSHNPAGELGIVGTLVTGPALRGNLTMLPPLEYGGPSTL